MNILGLFLVSIISAAVLAWMMRGRRPAQTSTPREDDTRGLLTSFLGQRKRGNDAMALVDDPRLAATAMMVSLAQSDGRLSAGELKTIALRLRTTLGATDAEAQEILARARLVVRDVTSAEICIRHLLPVISRRCGPAELAELVEMLEDVATADGPPDEIGRLALDRLKRTIAAL